MKMHPLLLVVFVYLAFEETAQAGDAPGPNKPNIVFLFADDQRSGTLNLGGEGNPETITPNLDKLARRGVHFRNAYVFGADRGSVCYPSRAQLLSGKSLFQSEMIDTPSSGIDDLNLPAALRLAGYQTMRSGKANNVPYGINMEFDVNVERANRGSVAGNVGYFQDASDFLDQKQLDGLGDVSFTWDGESPFFIYLAVGTPHEPYPRDEAAVELYKGKTVTAPKDALVLHDVYAELLDQFLDRDSTLEDVASETRNYYASISFMDRLFGELVEQLRAKGLYENTIFVFAGDNGLSIGSHGLHGKSNLMEFGGMHVPLIFAGPGVTSARSDALVYLLDVFPTLSDLAGAAKPASLDGKSLCKLLRGEEKKVRDSLLTVYTNDAELRAVRDDRWKLHYFPSKERYELYDLASDPRELKNLASDPAHGQTLARMKGLMERDRKHWKDPYPKAATVKRVFKKSKLPEGQILPVL
ncbi:sulfatase-like hydrolase/transferase [Rhodopirellula sallentina]|nr:sulfatase-like hydrolase/transferase [Rhodopirellula sallentina]